MTSILVVDDRAEVRDFLSTLLRYRDYKVTEASDGAEAIALARRDPPDLVVSDILMPRMDGYQFVRGLRDDPKLAHVPVIFNTAHFLGRQAQSLAQKLGVDHVITKPNEPEAVYAIVDRALGSGRSVEPVVHDGDLDREHLLVLTNGLRQKADELRAAHERMAELLSLARTLSGETEMSRALQAACSSARKLIGTRYVLSIVAKDDVPGHSIAGVAGFEAIDAEAFTAFPPRSGRLADLYGDSSVLNLSGLTGDPVAYGLPSGFPRVSNLLALPIPVSGRIAGWICAAEKIGLGAFDGIDVEIAATVASLLSRVLTCISMSDDLRRRARDLELEIGGRLATEAALRQSERRLRDLTEGVSDWLWETGPDLTFTYLSGGVRADAAVERQRHLGKRREQGAADPTDTPEWKHHLEDITAHRPFRDFTYRIFGPAGDIRVVRTSGQPMFDESGAFRGYHGVAVDITAQTALEQRQAELERRAAEAAHLESLGTFAGGIAHDINNLLIPIVALGGDLLEELPAADPHRDDVARIVDAGDAISDLVKQVLTFSRREVTPLRPIRPSEIIAKSRRLLRATLPSNVELKLDIDCEAGFINGNGSAILQVASNLCKNAGDAIGDALGHVTLSLAQCRMVDRGNRDDTPSGDYVRMTVQDDGCGMDAATRERIFEPFFTTKGIGKGMGVGMSVVHGIVTNHRGVIEIATAPGSGTKIDVYFPAITEEAAT